MPDKMLTSYRPQYPQTTVYPSSMPGARTPEYEAGYRKGYTDGFCDGAVAVVKIARKFLPVILGFPRIPK